MLAKGIKLPNSNKIQCDQCGYTTNRKSNFEVHIKMVHLKVLLHISRRCLSCFKDFFFQFWIENWIVSSLSFRLFRDIYRPVKKLNSILIFGLWIKINFKIICSLIDVNFRWKLFATNVGKNLLTLINISGKLSLMHCCFLVMIKYAFTGLSIRLSDRAW